LPQLAHKALIIQDVKDAVAAGKIVTISQSTISYKGWTGAGYSIVDPNTGAGAYLIGGGADGGFLIGIMVGSVLGIILMTAMATGGFITGPVSSTLLTIFIPELVIVIAILGVYLLTIKNDDKTFDCFVAGFKIGLGLGGIFQAFGDIDGTWQRKIAGLILSGLGLVFGASDLYSENQECITND
jgi:hypothetical protein